MSLQKKLENGWGGRARTFNPLIQSQVPYHSATPQRAAMISNSDGGVYRGHG